uniref:Probable WRKY transcription factor protein 1 n=1 Tax=Dermatophagoides pteronyssinus TaxID=6956 RepID=A0A6P6XZN7_DERPT|nr:probable WRKY transcription factor protein 1 [Dermatophagoides pteronyssinus]
MTDRFCKYHSATIPIPEPPRIVPIQPWIQDDSIDLNKNHLTTTIHPNKDTIKQFRRKFGIITGDQIDPEDSLIEDIKLIDLNNDDVEMKKSATNKRCDHNLQNQLQRMQNDIRNQLTKLHEKSNDSNRSTSDNLENNCLISTTPKQLFECIRKQDERLDLINKKIDQLIRLQQSSTIKQQIEQSICTTTIQQKSNHHNCMKKKSLSSEESPCSSSSINSSSTQSYLDSSIEKVRKDLHDSIRLKRNQQQTKVKQFLQSPIKSNKLQQILNDPPENENEFYTTILSEVNSILVRNGSVSTSTPLSKSKPRHPRQLLRTEQSIYIQRLASKYCMDDNDNDNYDDGENDLNKIDNHYPTKKTNDQIILESIRMTTGGSAMKKVQMTKNKQQQSSPKINYQKFQTNYDRYALSDHNSSIATRNYMDKYGLHIETKKKTNNNPKHHRYKPIIQSNLIENIANNDNDNDDDDEENYHDAKANMETDNHLPPPPPRDRLIDLDLVKKLPKLR